MSIHSKGQEFEIRQDRSLYLPVSTVKRRKSTGEEREWYNAAKKLGDNSADSLELIVGSRRKSARYWGNHWVNNAKIRYVL